MAHRRHGNLLLAHRVRAHFHRRRRWASPPLVHSPALCSHPPPPPPGASYVAEIGFRFYTKRAIKFTDAPNHKSFVMATGGGGNQADDLASSAWDHKNIAVLTQVGRQNGECADTSDLDWATAVYEVEEHGLCPGEEDEGCVQFRRVPRTC